MEKLYSLNLNINQLSNALEYKTVVQILDQFIHFTFMQQPRNAFIYQDMIHPLTSSWSYFNNNLWAMRLDEEGKIIFKMLTN